MAIRLEKMSWDMADMQLNSIPPDVQKKLKTSCKFNRFSRKEQGSFHDLLREFCVNQSSIVVHCRAKLATDAPITY